ncbi:lysophospholipase I [Amylocystis lapponica]|nr:lysophospholipase I [Amylocystis lapponica]
MSGAREPAEETIIISPRTLHSATVIFVHGLGDSGRGWKAVTGILGADPTLYHVKWVLPTAPIRSVTINYGVEMPSWYDIYDRELTGPQDEEGMMESARTLYALISAEIDAGLPANRILLGGFSQGGTMSILAGLSCEHKLGGIVVLSGRVPLPDKFSTLVKPQNKTVPIFWGHGKEDVMVKYMHALRSAELLRVTVGVPQAAAGAPQDGGLDFHAYDGIQHSTTPQELRDLKGWLQKVIPGPLQLQLL